MIEIEIPEQSIVVRKDGTPYAYYPYTSYLYLFNVVCMYKAQAITKNKLRKLTKNMSVYTEELVDTTDDIKTIVLSIIDDELVM